MSIRKSVVLTTSARRGPGLASSDAPRWPVPGAALGPDAPLDEGGARGAGHAAPTWPELTTHGAGPTTGGRADTGPDAVRRSPGIVPCLPGCRPAGSARPGPARRPTRPRPPWRRRRRRSRSRPAVAPASHRHRRPAGISRAGRIAEGADGQILHRPVLVDGDALAAHPAERLVDGARGSRSAAPPRRGPRPAPHLDRDRTVASTVTVARPAVWPVTSTRRPGPGRAGPPGPSGGARSTAASAQPAPRRSADDRRAGDATSSTPSPGATERHRLALAVQRVDARGRRHPQHPGAVGAQPGGDRRALRAAPHHVLP